MQGGFTVDGRHVSTAKAIFFFTIAVPKDILALVRASAWYLGCTSG